MVSNEADRGGATSKLLRKPRSYVVPNKRNVRTDLGLYAQKDKELHVKAQNDKINIKLGYRRLSEISERNM